MVQPSLMICDFQWAMINDLSEPYLALRTCLKVANHDCTVHENISLTFFVQYFWKDKDCAMKFIYLNQILKAKAKRSFNQGIKYPAYSLNIPEISFPGFMNQKFQIFYQIFQNVEKVNKYMRLCFYSFFFAKSWEDRPVRRLPEVINSYLYSLLWCCPQ